MSSFSGKLLILLVFFATAGCFKDKGSEPKSVVWDRETCVQCMMMLSSRPHAAQISADDGRTYFFDDVGCAVQWLNDQKKLKAVNFWVTDVETKKWIEAEKSHWQHGKFHTPMGHGFSATKKKSENSIGFAEVKTRVLASPSPHAHSAKMELNKK